MSEADPPPAPSQLISLADYERAAEQVLAPETFGYFFGGAGDEITLADNLAAWRRLAILPRMLVGVGTRDPGVTLLGKPRPHPLIVAPMAFQPSRIPTASSRRLEPRPRRTRSCASRRSGRRTSRRCPRRRRPPAAGFSSMSSRTGDSAASWSPRPSSTGTRRWSSRSIYRSSVTASANSGPRPTAATELIAGGGIAGGRKAQTPSEFAAHVDPDLNWSDIERFAADSPLPVLVKGILTPHDARRAADHGARAIVVSNHGARQLDTVLSGADALAAIVDAVGERLDVIVDGGIRRGTDVLKALALGARAVMVGRPVSLGPGAQWIRRRAPRAARSCWPSSISRWRWPALRVRNARPELRHTRAVGSTGSG